MHSKKDSTQNSVCVRIFNIALNLNVSVKKNMAGKETNFSLHKYALTKYMMKKMLIQMGEIQRIK